MCISNKWMLLYAFIAFLTSCSNSVSKVESQGNDSEPRREIEEIDGSRRTLFLSIDLNSDKSLVQLEYSKGNGSASPRVAEVFVKYGNGLKYKSFFKQTALVKSDKRLVVQELDSGLLRLIILSSENTNPIESGTLLSLSFEKTGDKPGKIEILTEQPIFASSEANEGLLVGDPIEI